MTGSASGKVNVKEVPLPKFAGASKSFGPGLWKPSVYGWWSALEALSIRKTTGCPTLNVESAGKISKSRYVMKPAEGGSVVGTATAVGGTAVDAVPPEDDSAVASAVGSSVGSSVGTSVGGSVGTSVGSRIAVSVGGTGVGVGSGVFALQAASNRPRMTNTIAVFFI